MMLPFYYDGWSWLWMAGFVVIFWGAVIVVAAWVIRSLARSTNDHAMATLRKRLAAGETTQNEYEKTKRALQS
jgi:uncharacterized membrane protein